MHFLSTKLLDNTDFKLISVISSVVNVHKKDLNNDTSQFLIMVMTHFFPLLLCSTSWGLIALLHAYDVNDVIHMPH